MNRSRLGFTLIELLVVIAIIAILAAILFPVFARARASARTAKCQGNLKQIGTAIKMYKEDFDGFMPSIDDGVNPMTTWCDFLQGYVKDWTVFLCPEHNPNPSWPAALRLKDGWPAMIRWTSYAMNTIFGEATSGWATRFRIVCDEQKKIAGGGVIDLNMPLDFSKTVMVADGSWNWFGMDGQDPKQANYSAYEEGVTPPQPTVNGSPVFWENNMIEYRHPRHTIRNGKIVQGGGANFLMADGHVEHLMYPVDFSRFDPTYNIWKD